MRPIVGGRSATSSRRGEGGWSFGTGTRCWTTRQRREHLRPGLVAQLHHPRRVGAGRGRVVVSVDLTGAADLHCHFGPDPHRERSVDAFEAAREARPPVTARSC